MPRPEQVALCQRIRVQERAAWELFITDQYETVFNMPNLYAQNRRYQEHDLADWFGYAYDRLYDGRRLGQFQGKSALRTYLYRRGSGVIYRLFLDWLRARREEIPGGDIIDTVKSRDNPETLAHERQQLKQVSEASQRLTPVRRIAFLVPEFAEALTEADYQYLAQVNGAAAAELAARSAEMEQRVASIVEQAFTDEDLACLLYPTDQELELQRRTTGELKELASTQKAPTEKLERFELLKLLRHQSNKGRINKLHSARRYARADLRAALGRDK